LAKLGAKVYALLVENGADEKFHLPRSLAFGQLKIGCEKLYLTGFLAQWQAPGV
jgi:hypothetical protein